MDFDDIIKFFGGAEDAASNAAAIGLGTAGLALAYDAYEDLGGIGREAYQEMSAEGGLADRLTGMLEFQPYTVTTATGGQFGMGQDPTTGAMTYNIAMSPEERAALAQERDEFSFGEAAGAAGGAAGRRPPALRSHPRRSDVAVPLRGRAGPARVGRVVRGGRDAAVCHPRSRLLGTTRPYRGTAGHQRVDIAHASERQMRYLARAT